MTSSYHLFRLQTYHKTIPRVLAPVSRKSRELFGPEKPFVKLRPAYSVKLVFSYVVKGIKIKITANFLASRRLRFEDTKRIMSPEIHPKSFGTFEKQAPDSKLPTETNEMPTLSSIYWPLRKNNNNNLRAAYFSAFFTYV